MVYCKTFFSLYAFYSIVNEIIFVIVILYLLLIYTSRTDAYLLLNSVYSIFVHHALVLPFMFN